MLRDEINQAGLRTSRGSIFTVQTLLPILENRVYLGECVYNQRTLSKWHRYTDGTSVERNEEGVERRPESDLVVCKDAWPALVDPETFEQVPRSRTESKGKAHRRGPAMKAKYLLTGLLFCGVCGGRGLVMGQPFVGADLYKSAADFSGDMKKRSPRREGRSVNFIAKEVFGSEVLSRTLSRAIRKLSRCEHTVRSSSKAGVSTSDSYARPLPRR